MSKKTYFKKALILFAILLLPSLLYLFLHTGTNNKKVPIILGPKTPVSSMVDGKESIDTIYHTIPNFQLTDQKGKPFSNSELKGNIYVANFFFATCPTICPKMTTNLIQVQDRFKDRDEVKLVSLTVNPEHDTPEVLNKYAERAHANYSKWKFLTGEKDSIYQVAFDGYFVSAQKDSIAPGGFLHSSNLILVDGKGRIRGYFDGTSVSETNDLFDAITILLAEKYTPRKDK